MLYIYYILNFVINKLFAILENSVRLIKLKKLGTE